MFDARRSAPLTTSRRKFCQTAAAALAAPYIVPASVFGAAAPSNRITVGVIGCGNQSMRVDLPDFLRHDDVQVVAVCDVNRGSYGYNKAEYFFGREPAQKVVNEHYAKRKASGEYKGCDAYEDFQEVLARPDIDAVVIVSPDHWHEYMTVRAAEAGKDIYCEKPLSLTVAGGRAMVDAVRKHKRVLQTGTQQRSNPAMRWICEQVREGRIGKLEKVMSYIALNNMQGPGPGWQPAPIPDGFNYDKWLGPAPEAPYHPDRCLYRFRFISDYSGGQITNFGAHTNDVAQWGIGADDTGPVEVEYMSAEWPAKGSLFNTALKSDYVCRYANGVELRCVSDPVRAKVEFIGTEGTMSIGYDGLKSNPASLIEGTEFTSSEQRFGRSKEHVRSFLDCVKSRGEPTAPVEVGHHSAVLCHLGMIACELGKRGENKVLKWDPDNERFTNSDEANKMLSRPARAPWSV